MKTAMMELIEYIEMNPIVFNKELLLKLKELTFKEKEQMIDFAIGAYQDISRMKGVSENLISENKILFENYYNKTYNNERTTNDNDRVY
jgi:hypothetical protein